MSLKRIIPVVAATLSLAPGAYGLEINGLKAGGLKDAGVESTETILKISGEMNAADFFYIFDNLAKLAKLDLSGVTITAYNGAPLPYTGISQSPAGTLPAYSLTGMTTLTEVTLPVGLKAIGAGALSGSGITKLTVPSGVVSIGEYAMMRCQGLTGVSMSDGVSEIGTRAFAYCPKLSTIRISNELKSIPEGLLEACGSLRELDLAMLAQCEQIGPWALANCGGVETLVLPARAEVLGSCALYGTSGIQTLTLPENLTRIDDGAMGAMTALETLRADNTATVPEIGRGVWSQVEQPNVTLVTPDNDTEAYQHADQWKEFHIVSMSEFESSTENIESMTPPSGMTLRRDGSALTVSALNKTLGTVSVYNAAGARVATASGSDSVIFDVGGWSRGVYLIVSAVGAAKIAI